MESKVFAHWTFPASEKTNVALTSLLAIRFVLASYGAGTGRVSVAELGHNPFDLPDGLVT